MIEPTGQSPFADWFNGLDAQAAAKIRRYLIRLEHGNTGALKGLGGGLQECRIHWGPGYRVYLGIDGDTLVILLGGGTKKRQQADITAARKRWDSYKQRKDA